MHSPITHRWNRLSMERHNKVQLSGQPIHSCSLSLGQHGGSAPGWDPHTLFPQLCCFHVLCFTGPNQRVAPRLDLALRLEGSGLMVAATGGGGSLRCSALTSACSPSASTSQGRAIANKPNHRCIPPKLRHPAASVLLILPTVFLPRFYPIQNT